MPAFDRSAVLANAVTSTGAGTPYWSSGRIEKPTFQLQGTSFNADVQGTNFFYQDAGSHWLSVASGITTNGLFNSDFKFAAFRVLVNSVSSGSAVSVALLG